MGDETQEDGLSCCCEEEEEVDLRAFGQGILGTDEKKKTDDETPLGLLLAKHLKKPRLPRASSQLTESIETFQVRDGTRPCLSRVETERRSSIALLEEVARDDDEDEEEEEECRGTTTLESILSEHREKIKNGVSHESSSDEELLSFEDVQESDHSSSEEEAVEQKTPEIKKKIPKFVNEFSEKRRRSRWSRKSMRDAESVDQYESTSALFVKSQPYVRRRSHTECHVKEEDTQALASRRQNRAMSLEQARLGREALLAQIYETEEKREATEKKAKDLAATRQSFRDGTSTVLQKTFRMHRVRTKLKEELLQRLRERSLSQLQQWTRVQLRRKRRIKVQRSREIHELGFVLRTHQSVVRVQTHCRRRIPRYLFVRGQDIKRRLLNEVLADIIPKLALNVWKNWKQDARCKYLLDTDQQQDDDRRKTTFVSSQAGTKDSSLFLLEKLLAGKSNNHDDKIVEKILDQCFLRKRQQSSSPKSPCHQDPELSAMRERARAKQAKPRRNMLGALRSSMHEGASPPPPLMSRERPSPPLMSPERPSPCSRRRSTKTSQRRLADWIASPDRLETPSRRSMERHSVEVSISGRPLVSLTWIPQDWTEETQEDRPSYSRGLARLKAFDMTESPSLSTQRPDTKDTLPPSGSSAWLEAAEEEDDLSTFVDENSYIFNTAF